MNYVVVTPVRNEQDHFPRTIASMITQTMRPARWVIVDDGSQDRTGALADASARTHPWIRVVHRKDRGRRSPGTGVIEAFYEGYALLDEAGWSFLAKLDGDVEFESDYFEKCLRRFAADEELGIGGGRVYRRASGILEEDSPDDPAFHVRGATKIYRRGAWEAIGGLLRAPGWDGLDELKANMCGWKTYSFPELKVVQLKATGSADGTWRNHVKNGLSDYISGYHPLFMIAKCAKRFFHRPLHLEPWGLICGFISGYLQKVPQTPDRKLIKYLRRQQMNRLLLKPSLWN
jgi:glycosyltransferase involved in cell wall biosynthesis